MFPVKDLKRIKLIKIKRTEKKSWKNRKVVFEIKNKTVENCERFLGNEK